MSPTSALPMLTPSLGRTKKKIRKHLRKRRNKALAASASPVVQPEADNHAEDNSNVHIDKRTLRTRNKSLRKREKAKAAQAAIFSQEGHLPMPVTLAREHQSQCLEAFEDGIRQVSETITLNTQAP